MKRLLFVLLFCGSLFAQNSRSDGVVFSRNGFPAPAASIAVCSPVAITAASEVVGTVTITSTLNPAQGSTVQIVGMTPTQYNGSYTVLTTSGTNFTYTNPTQGLGAGTVFGTALVTSTTPCSPLAPLCASFTDSTCTSSNPVTGDGLGNYSFYVKPGRYTTQVYGSGLTTRLQPDQVLTCDPSNCTMSNVGVFTNTQMNEYDQSLLNSCSPAAEFHRGFGGGNNATDALTGCVATPVGATALNSDAITGYANNSSTGSNTVGLFALVTCLVNSSNCWGANPVVQDVAAITGAKLIGTEVDVNVQNTSTTGEGLLINGNFTAQPTSNNFPAFIINKPGANQWTSGLLIQQGATTAANSNAGVEIFPQAAGANQQSQNILLCANNAGATLNCGSIGTDVNGNPSFIPPAGGGMIVTRGISTSAPPNGLNTGFQHIRVSGCATGAAQFNTCDTTVTWANAFANANYTATCTGDVVTSGVPQIEGIDISAAKLGASITVRTIALTAAAAQFTTIDCTAVHD